MIGSLNKRVTIQAESLAADGAGGAVKTWANVDTVWASVEPTAGREYLYGMQLEAAITHIVTMRHRADVSPVNRLLYDARSLNIRAALDMLERGRYLRLLCVEGAAS